MDMKRFLFIVCCSRVITGRVEYEHLWKDCVEAIGQTCKNACDHSTVQLHKILLGLLWNNYNVTIQKLLTKYNCVQVIFYHTYVAIIYVQVHTVCKLNISFYRGFTATAQIGVNLY